MSTPEFDVGSFRQEIKVLARLTNQDGAGEPVAVWAAVSTNLIRAHVQASTGSEAFSSLERSGFIPTTFVIRHPRTDYQVLPQYRLVWRNRLFDIKSAIDPDGLQRFMVITCEERIGEPIL